MKRARTAPSYIFQMNIWRYAPLGSKLPFIFAVRQRPNSYESRAKDACTDSSTSLPWLWLAMTLFLGSGNRLLFLFCWDYGQFHNPKEMKAE
ncbi:MAG: hypothetical protein A2951_01790 [Candidatus Buchananbacteria bacterium RIFCSPLOWO2_01_FULL_56_15]|uniref:Uncharacterized protein n=1 Tax=Candidatus Buchananbacteria bacterium RIFCSPLOWO2_01_FULL_56_15 TaxID=1797547 RepID=A0A1G1YSH8_9BACT|nr:MAG: hypothetical protein A2951_01790 [Candidatus Buchananbacteria bacterium RIFCSPLOWO2_01_FULL_56_15]